MLTMRSKIITLIAVSMFVSHAVRHMYLYTLRRNLKENLKVPKEEAVYYDKNGVCTKGSIGTITDSEIHAEFQVFMQVWSKRPVENDYGTKLAHQFALWTMVRKLKPKHIIESGVYIGMGTLMLRKAAPHAQLILLDPSSKAGSAYKDSQSDTKYFLGAEFKDFADMDWDVLGIDRNQTLVFFDDHQSNVKRLRQAQKFGFRHIMFDDNANYDQGYDSLSLNAACDIFLERRDPSKMLYKDNFNKIVRPFKDKDLKEIKTVFENEIEVYFEFPFPWKHPNVKNIWFPELTLNGFLDKYGFKGLPSIVNEYWQICYVRLK